MNIGFDFDGTICDHRDHKLELASRHGFALEPWQTNSNVMSAHLPEEIYRPLSNELYGAMTLKAPPVAGALETIAGIAGRLYIISARRPESAPFALEWMQLHGLLDLIPPERVIFCERDGDKHAHCVEHGIDVFIDDKLKVLQALPEKTVKIWLDTDGVSERLAGSDSLKLAKNWAEAAAIFAALETERSHA